MGLIGLIVHSLFPHTETSRPYNTHTTRGCYTRRAQPAYLVQPQPMATQSGYLYAAPARPSCHQRKMERRAQRKMQRAERCMLRAEQRAERDLQRAERRGAGVMLVKAGMHKAGITGGHTRDADAYEMGEVNHQQQFSEGTRGLENAEIAALKQDAPPAYHEIEKK